MKAPARLDWTEANQRLLAAEFARLKAFLGEGDAGRATQDVETARQELPTPAAIDLLADTFGLSAFERDVLLLTAGVEMDAGLAALCGEVSGQPQRPWATFGLALAALPEPHWSALTPVRPLRRWRLVEVDERAGLATARLRVDERVLHYLAGIDYLDTCLQPLMRAVAPPHVMAEGQRRVAHDILEALRDSQGPPPVVVLSGDDSHGQEDVAAQVASAMGAGLLAIAAADLPSSLQELDALATLWQREVALAGNTLLIEKAESASADVVRRLVETLRSLTFVAGRDPLQFPRPTLQFVVNRPQAPEQRQLWQAMLGPAADRLDGTLDGIASQYRLSARSISDAAQRIGPVLSSGEEPDATSWQSALRSGASMLDTLAQRIEPMAQWDDLILPEAQKSTLREIAAHLRYRLRVYYDWGFAGKSARGLGISALFVGESGTGKTMAAEVLARELGLELYRIDLSAVVDKYIGETEKNLRRLFDAAEESGALLLFDEADALFGKRSEVKDSHDRYANIEISYLLQRMEAYRGLAILTTNLKTAMDVAFQRRLRFVVHFPFPDLEQRESIWQGIFPAAAPREAIDYGKLARLDVSGGRIRNIALNAAFSAAREQEPVRMRHLLQAARADAAKQERTLTDAETRGWV